MEEYVINPLTNRAIKVEGYTYNKLLKQGTIQPQTLPTIMKNPPTPRYISKPIPSEQIQKMGEMNLYQPDFEQSKQHVTQPYLINRSQTYKTGNPRGQRTRGWALDSPKRGSERHLLKEKCGDRCFLIPDQEGFPICPKCVNNECKCEIDCRGLIAAKARAKQLKYTNLEQPIEQLYQSKCQ